MLFEIFWALFFFHIGIFLLRAVKEKEIQSTNKNKQKKGFFIILLLLTSLNIFNTFFHKLLRTIRYPTPFCNRLTHDICSGSVTNKPKLVALK